MRGNATDCVLARDILEWNVPEVTVVSFKIVQRMEVEDDDRTNY